MHNLRVPTDYYHRTQLNDALIESCDHWERRTSVTSAFQVTDFTPSSFFFFPLETLLYRIDDEVRDQSSDKAVAELNEDGYDG